MELSSILLMVMRLHKILSFSLLFHIFRLKSGAAATIDAFNNMYSGAGTISNFNFTISITYSHRCCRMTCPSPAHSQQPLYETFPSPSGRHVLCKFFSPFPFFAKYYSIWRNRIAYNQQQQQQI